MPFMLFAFIAHIAYIFVSTVVTNIAAIEVVSTVVARDKNAAIRAQNE
jgi:hypothetical protein